MNREEILSHVDALLVCLRNIVLQFNFSYVIIRYIKILKHRSEKEYQQYRE